MLEIWMLFLAIGISFVLATLGYVQTKYFPKNQLLEVSQRILSMSGLLLLGTIADEGLLVFLCYGSAAIVFGVSVIEWISGKVCER